MTALQKMFQTSGVSGEGICPSTDDGELLDELKPLYKNGFHLSKKRLAVGYQFAGGSCTATELRRMPPPIALLEVVGHHQQGNQRWFSPPLIYIFQQTMENLVSHL